MQDQATSRARTFAKRLRTSLTDAEQRLWRGLRSEQLGVKFRRQHPLGNYIADFACLAPKLVVELDGAQHAEQAGYDERRDAFLRAQGFGVLRFASNEALSNTDGVLSVILERVTALKAEAPIPAFPQRGKEQGLSGSVPSRPSTELGTAAPIPAFPQRGKEQDPKRTQHDHKSVQQDTMSTDPELLLPPLGEGRDGGSSH